MGELVDVLVEFDYDAEEKDELTIRPGDVIRNVSRSDGGWWEGELNGKVGVFPDNFVRVFDPKEDPHKKDGHHKKDEMSHGHKKEDSHHHKREDSHKGSHVKELKNVLARQPGQVATLPGVVKRNRDSLSRKKRSAKVIYSYNPENPDELRLEPGDIVEILNEEEEGWWKGSLRGNVGMFPSNFVSMEGEENEKNEIKEQNDDKPASEVVEIKGKKVKGIGLGNIFGDHEIKLRPAGSVKEKSSTLAHDSGPPQPIKPIEKARVSFNYVANNEDELSLQEGEIVTVLSKDIEDSGWWLGELNGKRGVFPDNFVELLPVEEVKPKKPPPPSMPSPVSADGKKINKSHPESKSSGGSIKKDNNDKSAPPLPGRKPDLPPPMRRPAPKENKGESKKNIEHDNNDKSAPPLPGRKPDLPPPMRRPAPKENKGESKKNIEHDNNDKSAPPLPGRKPDLPPPMRRPAPKENKGESKKNIEHDNNDKSAPPLPGRKPDLPPPMRRPAPKENKGESKKNIEHDLDVIESHEMLKHLTGSRPKNPNRRPPSMELLHRENGDAESDELPWMKDKSSASLPRGAKLEMENEKNKEEKVIRRAPALPPQPRPESLARSPAGIIDRPLTIIGEPPVNNREVEELKRELTHLKENTVSKDKYHELCTDMKSLKEQLESMRQMFNKKLYDLMDELDEEKKIRLSTQVEMERIRKLHMTT